MIGTKTYIFIAIGFLGIACAILFSLIGQTVDANGVLHEPFFLIPVGYALMAVGTVGSLTSYLLSVRREPRID